MIVFKSTTYVLLLVAQGHKESIMVIVMIASFATSCCVGSECKRKDQGFTLYFMIKPIRPSVRHDIWKTQTTGATASRDGVIGLP